MSCFFNIAKFNNIVIPSAAYTTVIPSAAEESIKKVIASEANHSRLFPWKFPS